MTLQLAGINRADLPKRDWNAFVQQHKDGWWFHTSAWIDYALAYTPGARDMSTAIVLTDARGTYYGLKALVPGVLAPDGVTLVYGGQPQPAPLELAEVGPSVALHVGGKGHPWADSFVAAYRPGHIDTFESQDGYALQTDTTFVVDLWDGTAEDQLKKVRKTYRHLIRKNVDLYDVVVISKTDDRSWLDKAHALHRQEASRETRPQATWDIQQDWITAGYGVLALAIAKESREPVGFAYAIRFRDWAYYFSAASLVSGVQHSLQWELMNALRADGQTQYYELGHDARPGDDDKAQQIAFFKSGFGGERWRVHSVVKA